MKKKILLIDDEVDILEMLAQALSHEGYEVSMATSGLTARDAFRDGIPDLIISDLQMEDTDGFTLIEEFKKSWPDLPVILLTGVIFDPETIAETVDKKGLVYVPKTSPIRRIREEVKRLLA